MSWVPLDTRATRFLPKNRPYTELEASFALQVDYWRDHPATVAGYAAQWKWSRDRVRSWLADLGLQIQGQTGRHPGRLVPKSATCQVAHSDPSATGQLMFHDFGRLGDPPRQQPASNQPAVPQQHATPIYIIGTSDNTTPLSPPDFAEKQGGEGVMDNEKINEYVLLAARQGACKDPVGLAKHMKANGGLSSRHLSDLNLWKNQRLPGNPEAARTLKYLDNLGKEEDPQSPWLDS